MQGQGSRERSNCAEGAWGRPGRAEGLLVRRSPGPDCPLWGNQMKSTSGLWLAQVQGHPL